MTIVIRAKIRSRRDTAANWTAANPVLRKGEEGWETDTFKEKLGDGVTAWNALPYVEDVIGGDVVGPSGAVNNNVVTFNLTTGKVIKDSGIAASSLVLTTGAQSIGGQKTFTVTQLFQEYPSIQKLSAPNDARVRMLQILAGADGTLGPLNFDVWAYPSATGANRFASISVADSIGARALILNYIGSGSTFGRVGIGTSAPAELLEVAGRLLVSGTSGRVTVAHTTNIADGMLLANTTVVGGSSPRLFFQNDVSAAGIYMSGGTLVFTSGATPGSASGTAVMGVSAGAVGVTGSFSATSNISTSGGQIAQGSAGAASGIIQYNTVDQSTNYERGRSYWVSNIYTTAVEAGGTGTPRTMAFLANSASLTLGGTDALSLSRAGGIASLGRFTSTGLTAASGTQTGLLIDPTINQSGTAAYAALNIAVTQTATGTGFKRLVTASVGGTTRFVVDNNGTISQILPFATTGALAVSATGDTANRFLVTGSGGISWGPGNAAADTTLYRAAAGALRTDGTFSASRIFTSAAAGLSAFGAAATGDTNNRFEVAATGSLAWSPGDAVPDTNLYRNSAGVLKTDGRLDANLMFTVAGFQAPAMASATSMALMTAVAGDANGRWFVRADGQMRWGPGNAVDDTGLHRAGANTLRTDGLFSSAGAPINTQTGTSYTLVLSDAGKWISLSNTSTVTVTVPNNATVAFPIGAEVTFMSLNTGDVTMATGAGVSIVNADSTLAANDTYAVWGIKKIATDTWIMFGRTG